MNTCGFSGPDQEDAAFSSTGRAGIYELFRAAAARDNYCGRDVVSSKALSQRHRADQDHIADEWTDRGPDKVHRPAAEHFNVLRQDKIKSRSAPGLFCYTASCATGDSSLDEERIHSPVDRYHDYSRRRSREGNADG